MKILIIFFLLFVTACSSSSTTTKIDTAKKLKDTEELYYMCLEDIKDNEFLGTIDKIYREEFCACFSARSIDTITYSLLNAINSNKYSVYDDNSPVNQFYYGVAEFCGAQLLPIWIKKGARVSNASAPTHDNNSN